MEHNEVNRIGYVPEGMMISSAQNREYTSSLAGLERARDEGVILEGTVILCDAALDLHVDFPALPGVEGLIPREEAVYTRPGETVKDIAILTRVGKAVCFKVLGIREPDARGIVTVLLSRRAAQAECATVFLPTLIPGDIIRARVTHLEAFGAFVDIGCGLSSLLSVDTISVSRIMHPRDRLWSGQLIWAVVKSVDHTTGRIFVSTKELLGTWEQNAASFRAGQTVAGIVRSVEDYGVFVELTPNLAGLAELRDGERCDGRGDPRCTAEVGDYYTRVGDAVSRTEISLRNPDARRYPDARCNSDARAFAESLIGRTAAVFIKSIIPERMKIKLVLLDACRADAASAIAPPRLNWYIRGDRTSHIDRWVYSPEGARKRVESLFVE